MRNIPIHSDTIHNTDEAIAYLVECTLSTIDDHLMRSNTPRRELDRQIRIAETGLAWIGAGYKGGCPKVNKVRKMGSVATWAARNQTGSDKT